MTTDRVPTIAVVGATGMVGEVALDLIAKVFGAKARVYALASEASVGREVSCGRRSLVVDDVAHFDFSGCDFALFSAGSDVSRAHAPRAVEAGAIVVDNSAAFRQDPEVPLVVPELNGEVLSGFSGGIVANPNCSTIQMCMALAPIHRSYGLQSVVVSTYQSVSGAGREAMQELGQQAVGRFNFQEPIPEVFDQPIAFNVLAQIGPLEPNGFSQEEMKMHHETRRILQDDQITVHATAVRVPVFVGHSLAIWAQTRKPCLLPDVERLLTESPGVQLTDALEVASPLVHGKDQDAVWVSRLRLAHGAHSNNDGQASQSLMMWVVADNLRKGAALNALQIIQQIWAQR